MTALPRKQRITLERTFDKASIEDVWDLWTTKEGIESWWGPEGFETKVRKLELRPGGELVYAMTAVAPEQVAFMKQAGMPLTSETRHAWQEIVPHRRLAWQALVDFVPGVAPYSIACVAEFHAGKDGVRLVLTLDAMHDAQWTKMAAAGWESQLGKLARAIR